MKERREATLWFLRHGVGKDGNACIERRSIAYDASTLRYPRSFCTNERGVSDGFGNPLPRATMDSHTKSVILLGQWIARCGGEQD
jgi:hypothetical protein